MKSVYFVISAGDTRSPQSADTEKRLTSKSLERVVPDLGKETYTFRGR